jgi:hypothetical protein
MRNGCPHNPFSVQGLGPDNMGYVFAEGASLAPLVSRLDAAGWRAELVGPHGVGKSTLLHTLAGEAQARGMRVVEWRCAQGSRPLPRLWRWRLPGTDVVFLDSGENAAARRLASLKRHCERRGIGLVVTMHEPSGWGMELRLEATPRQLLEVVRSVAGDAPGMDEAAAGRLLHEHGGNAREALFALYDRHEERGRVTAFPR